jgi:hypothetical protein
VAGSPVDQFSFLESSDGQLNVLVRSEAGGDAMWRPEVADGEVALLRFPIRSFGDGTRDVPSQRYRDLPTPNGDTFQNRFVEEHLLFGTGNGWGTPLSDTSRLYVTPIRGGAVTTIALPHGVDRIEAMGPNAVIVGTDGHDLHFTGVRLGTTPSIRQRFTLANAAQGELRSHGFFYKPDSLDSGTLGLPVRAEGSAGYRHLVEGSASVLFLRNANGAFTELGDLAAKSVAEDNDGCRASCVDWYGNARPLFIRGRILALLGYEIVEGRSVGGRFREVRRVSFAPPAAKRTER